MVAMLLKLIRCQVDAPRRAAFEDGQSVWSALADRPGFGSQFGGWEDDAAWLAAWWHDWPSYAAFHADGHDGLQARGGQRALDLPTTVSYWQVLEDDHIDGRTADEVDRAPEGLQVEHFELAPGMLPEFRDFLAWRWRPALAGSPGMHEAWLCRHRKHPGRYVVLSTWDRPGQTRSMAGLLQPGWRLPQRRHRLLRRHAAHRITLHPAWTVRTADAPGTVLHPRGDR